MEDASLYFVKALKNSLLGGKPDDTLEFPVDGPEAWKFILHWMSKGALPSLDHLCSPHDKQTLLVRIWALGEKYSMPKVQDLTMLEILSSLRHHDTSIEIVKEACETTPPLTKLRMVMAEEALHLSKHDQKGFGPEQFQIFDGVTGWSVELMRAVARCENKDPEPNSGASRLAKRSDWAECLTGVGPEKHWLHRSANGKA